jgi:hypothetical protein
MSRSVLTVDLFLPGLRARPEMHRAFQTLLHLNRAFWGRRAVHMLSWRRNENGGSKMKGKLITLFVGMSIAAGSWSPLLIVAARDRYAMPVGLGLFAIAGSFVGGAIALVGLIRLVIQASRASKARSCSA